MVLMGRARRIGLYSQPAREDEAAALEALERFGLGDYARRAFHELSGGQRQLVVFARAIVAEAEILILDEPTSALDLRHQALILKWIGTLSREHGLTIVMTTHHPHHALAVADAALLMQGEADYTTGPVSQILTEASLGRLYGAPLKRLSFEHEGRRIETFAAIPPARNSAGKDHWGDAS